MRELFLQIVYGRTQSAFSEDDHFKTPFNYVLLTHTLSVQGDAIILSHYAIFVNYYSDRIWKDTELVL